MKKTVRVIKQVVLWLAILYGIARFGWQSYADTRCIITGSKAAVLWNMKTFCYSMYNGTQVVLPLDVYEARLLRFRMMQGPNGDGTF